MIVLGDPPEVWERLGFAPDADGMVALGEERLHLTGRGGGILRITAPQLTAEDPDGLPLGAEQPAEAAAVAHPNGATVVDHVVALTGSASRTVAALQAAGLDLRRKLEGMAFLRLGPYILEVVERDAADPPSFWGLVVVVPDPGAVPGTGPMRDAVQRGRRIATVRDGLLGTKLALMSRRL